MCSLLPKFKGNTRTEFGYTVSCEEATFSDGSTKSRWSISGQKIPLPSSWRNIGSAASTFRGNDGTLWTKYDWYQLDQSPPARQAGGGILC